MKKIISNTILILGILISLSSCIGQNNAPYSKPSTKPILGKIVAKLDQTIWSIHQDINSNFWFGSKENGVYYFNGQNLRLFSEEDGLISNEIRGIQEDSSGNLFFETMAGISKFDSQTFKTLEIKEPDSTNAEWKLEPNDLWFRIGFDNKGPYRYDGEYLHYLEFPKAPYEEEFYRQRPAASFSPYGIYSIYKDKNGLMWFGTAAIGLCQFDGNSFSWHYEEQLQKASNGGDFGTRAIFQDNDGFFWFNNSRYRYKILPNQTNHLNYSKENGIGYVNENEQTEYPYFLSVTQDNDGDLWMVTYADGVWKNNGNELINYPIKDGDTNVLLFSIFKDNQGILWLGTHNAGAYKFNGNSFEKFDP